MITNPCFTPKVYTTYNNFYQKTKTDNVYKIIIQKKIKVPFMILVL